MHSDKEKVVDARRTKIESSKGTEIWQDYINSLKLISQVVFTRSSGCVLELIQNAEDAGQGLSEAGVFDIRISPTRLKITHNARPFSDGDVKAISGIRSSKKPERGTLGYLGIGFKSVFKITDRPEIYSNGFQFEFDRNYAEWENPSETPWHVLPIWIPTPSEPIEPEKTTFIIPFREAEHYSTVLSDLRKIGIELYLFLGWLKKIRITDEGSGNAWSLESVGEADGITTFIEKGQTRRFKVFRKEVDVPDWVKQDRLTQEYRANVPKRQIAIAFALDDQRNLKPTEAGAMYGGVYSFMPLGESSSGAKFPIQADFLVQPGRDAINYEAKWNAWLLDEIVILCRKAIQELKQHSQWKYQFLRAFEFSKKVDLESQRKLFLPKLIQPLEDFLNEDTCVATKDGGWARRNQVVMIDETQEAVKALVNLRVLRDEELAPVLGGAADMVVAHPSVDAPLRKVSRWELLDDSDFLKAKAGSPQAAEWFRLLYAWLAKYPKMESYRPYRARLDRYRVMGYHKYQFVLTTDGSLRKGGEVLLADLPFTDDALKEWASALRQSKPVVNPEIFTGITNEDERKSIRGFLIGLAGVQILDGRVICKEALLPKILTGAAKPLLADLIKYTRYCHQILEKDSIAGNELWVLTKQHAVMPAKEVLISREFKPSANWEAHQQYVLGITFLSPDYLVDTPADSDLKSWRDFFRAGGIKESPDNGVEEFAMKYAERHFPYYCKTSLEIACRAVVVVDARNFGYDLSVELDNGRKLCVEVKGLSRDDDIELTGNETRAADTQKESYFLCVVSSIPEMPLMYVVRNPAVVGRKDRLIIPAADWKESKWQPVAAS